MSSNSEVGGFTSGFSGSASRIAQMRPPESSGGMVGVSTPGSTPSTPSTRMFFFSRLTMRWAIAEVDRSSEDRSSTTGLPTKKPGERASVASMSASHSMTGTTGENTKAT